MPENDTVPAPGYLSEAAKAALTQRAPAFQFPDLADTTGWEALVGQVDGYIRSRFDGVDLPVEQRQIDIDGVPTVVLHPAGKTEDGPLYIDLHGGALVFGGGLNVGVMAAPGVLSTGLTHWAPDYRMPPRHPYPAALDDVLTVYRAALAQRQPSEIFIGGGSAGGNLAAALLLRAKAEGLPMPAGLLLIAPELDLTESGDTFLTLRSASNALTSLMPVNLLYAGGNDLADPYLSPLFGDVTGFPPTLLAVGTRDLFLSNAARMHRRLRNAGVEADLHVFDAMPHGGFGGAPEDEDLAIEIKRFIEAHRPH